MQRIAIPMLGLLCVTAVAAQKPIHGKIEGRVTWSGKVVLDGDVTVVEGAELQITPGTEVRIQARDFTKEGFHPERIEIQVMGRLIVQGTKEKPVSFAPAKDDPEQKVLWHGIVLRPKDLSGRPSELRSVRFTKAFAAVQVPFGSPRITDSVFLECQTGIEVGTAYRDARQRGVKPDVATPEVRGCRFAQCRTGVFAENLGSPDLHNSVFFRCGIGAGNSRPGVAFSLLDPGIVVQRCAFLNNGVGILGQGAIQDSIFMGNGVAVRLSNFHRLFSANIDHIAVRSNLYHDNRAILEGDTGIDNAPILGDPRFSGSLAALEKPGPALPDCLKLGAGSKAKGVATDGGDLGPLGTYRVSGEGSAWAPSGAVVTDYLALPVHPKERAASIGRSKPKIGKTAGKVWWVSAPVGAQRELDLGALFGSARKGWVAFTVQSSKAGDIDMEFNGDVRAGVAYIGGKSQDIHGLPYRYGAKGRRIAVTLSRGKNVIVMQLETWGKRPRLGISFASGVTTKPGKPATAKPMEIASGRFVNRRGERYYELNMKSKLHWGDTGRNGIAIVTDAAGKKLEGSFGLTAEIVSSKKLRLRDVPAEWPRPVQIALVGLRGMDGVTVPKGKPKEVK